MGENTDSSRPTTLYDAAFVPQAAFVKDQARYIAAICTRRAGKTTGLGFKFFNYALHHNRSGCAYLGLTRDSARSIMWPILQQINNRYVLGCEFKESNLTVECPNGSTIKLIGADQRNFINRLKGAKYPFVAIDEAQAFGAHLQDLVDEVIDPAVADYENGQIALTGTPGPVPKGYFYESTRGAFGFKVHRWTVYDNPYFPRPHEYVRELFLKKGWTRETPTFRREWLGEWVADPDALVYRFEKERNTTQSLPSGHEWLYVVGVDLGYDPDPSAFVVGAYSMHLNKLFIVEEYKKTRLTVSDVAERVRYYLKRYNNPVVVMDAGAQGKMIVEEINQRHGLQVFAAEKSGKAGFIEIMNSDFQNGVIQVLEDRCPELTEEWQRLIWDQDKEQRTEDSRYDNHLADACLYMWRYCHNYASQPKEVQPKRGSEEEIDRWIEQEAMRIGERQRKERELYG